MQFSLESIINNSGPEPTGIKESQRDRPKYYEWPSPVQKNKIITLEPKKHLDPISCRIADAMIDYARRHEININVRGFKRG